MCAINFTGGLLIGIVIAVIATIIASIIASVISFRRGIEFRRKKAEAEIGSAEQEAKIISEAQMAKQKREVLLKPRKRFIKAGWNLTEKSKTEEMRSKTGRGLVQKEETLDRKVESLEKKKRFSARRQRKSRNFMKRRQSSRNSNWKNSKEYRGCLLKKQRKFFLRMWKVK